MKLIKYQSGITHYTLEYIDQNLYRLGEVKKITHKRNRQIGFYETTIEGTKDTMVITGGLSSGYIGEGSNGMLKFLKKVGIPEDKARSFIFDNTDNEYSFTIKL